MQAASESIDKERQGSARTTWMKTCSMRETMRNLWFLTQCSWLSRMVASLSHSRSAFTASSRVRTFFGICSMSAGTNFCSATICPGSPCDGSTSHASGCANHSLFSFRSSLLGTGRSSSHAIASSDRHRSTTVRTLSSIASTEPAPC
eukprot:2704286-Rhodomonas_salina.1